MRCAQSLSNDGKLGVDEEAQLAARTAAQKRKRLMKRTPGETKTPASSFKLILKILKCININSSICGP